MNAPIRRTGVMRMMDTLASMITGLNTSKDRSTGLAWAVNELNQSVVEAMYRGDWIARKIINAPAQDSTRQWRQWQADNDQIEEIEKIEKLFHIQSRTKQALIKARLYGGAALILGVEDDKDPSEELDLESIRKDALKFVHAVSKYELFNEAGQLETDLLSPYFGQPRMYARQVKGGDQIRIHPSRIIRIMGEEYPNPDMSPDSWGESVLQSVHDACRNAGLITQSIATLMDEMKVDVIKIPDLTRQLGDQESSDRLTERLSYGMLSKSTVNALVMDKEDEWETRTMNLAGLPDIIKTYLQIAAGAADIPATRLLGQSPSGLSATGESDIRNYYDHISSEQVNTLSPALDRLDQIIIRSALGTYDESIFYEWNPLWQMTESEEADIAAKRAATFKIDVDTMIVPTDALKEGRINQLIEAGTYPGLEQAIEDSDGEVVNPKLEAQLALAEKNAELNPPVPSNGKPGEKVVPFKKKAPAVKDARFTDSTPRTLYVRRDLLNGEDIVQWAKAQGFQSTLPASDMHVTIAFSRQPVDWMKINEDYMNPPEREFKVHPSPIRVVEKFNGGACVLLFNSSALAWRHEDIKRAGASFDFPDYQPHITFHYYAEGEEELDLSKIIPYRGEIVLGPEIFEQINDDWKSGIKEDAYNPSQPRDPGGPGGGQWISGGESASAEDLESKLNEISEGQIKAYHQAENDPDLDKIIDEGKTWKRDVIIPNNSSYRGPESDCHWNVARLFEGKKIDAVVIGYAKNDQGWHQHTWGVKGGKVVETTLSNEENSYWFGLELNKKQSSDFAKFVLNKKNVPGMGNVRTRKGGHKIS